MTTFPVYVALLFLKQPIVAVHNNSVYIESVCAHMLTLNLNLKCFMAWVHAKAQIDCVNPEAYLGSQNLQESV